MADTQFDEAKAKAWATEVEGELEQVDALLKQVAEECATQPYEDDTIMNMLHQTGEALGTAWSELGKQFTDTISNMFSLISTIASFVAKAAEAVANWTGSVKN